MTPERQASWFLHLFDRRPTNDVECYVVPYRRRRVSARATWHAYSYELCRFSLMETVKSTMSSRTATEMAVLSQRALLLDRYPIPQHGRSCVPLLRHIGLGEELAG